MAISPDCRILLKKKVGRSEDKERKKAFLTGLFLASAGM